MTLATFSRTFFSLKYWISPSGVYSYLYPSLLSKDNYGKSNSNGKSNLNPLPFSMKATGEGVRAKERDKMLFIFSSGGSVLS